MGINDDKSYSSSGSNKILINVRHQSKYVQKLVIYLIASIVFVYTILLVVIFTRNFDSTQTRYVTLYEQADHDNYNFKVVDHTKQQSNSTMTIPLSHSKSYIHSPRIIKRFPLIRE